MLAIKFLQDMECMSHEKRKKQVFRNTKTLEDIVCTDRSQAQNDFILQTASLGKEWFEIRMEETHDTYPGNKKINQ